MVVNDPVAEFAVVDANGGGFVLFDEFAGWALQKGLDMLDDGDEEGEETLANAHKSAEQVAAQGARDAKKKVAQINAGGCLLYTSPSPRD